jgi:hypothetical protein
MKEENKEEIKDKKGECQHNWVPLMGKDGQRYVPTALFTCLECGDLKVGRHTIRISGSRMDMDNKPIKNIGNPGTNEGGARNIFIQSGTPTATATGDIWIVTA